MDLNGILALNETNDIRKGLPYINVKQFGAKGDGITDDTYSIQSAINHANVGDTVFLPAGDYLISNTIRIDKKITLIGSGWGTILRKDTAASFSSMIHIENASGVIEDLFLGYMLLTGSRQDVTSMGTIGIVAKGLHKSVFKNVKVKSMPGTAYFFDVNSNGDHSNTVYLEDCWAFSNNGYSVYFSPSTDDMHINGGDYGWNGFASGGAGVYMSSPSSSIKNSTIWGAQGSGVYLGPDALSNQIIGNNIEGHKKHGIHVETSHVFISNNKIYANANTSETSGLYDGIYVQNGQEKIIYGLQITGNKIYSGLYVDNGVHRYQISLGLHEKAVIIGNEIYYNDNATYTTARPLVYGLNDDDMTDYSWTNSYVEAALAAATTLSGGAWTTLNFSSKAKDGEAEFDGLVFTPKTTARYDFDVSVMLNGESTGLKMLRVVADGVEYRIDVHQLSTTGWDTLKGSITLTLQAGSNVEIQAYSQSGDKTMNGSAFTRTTIKLRR